MAPINGEPLLGQTVHEMAAPKDDEETDHKLREFRKCSEGLRDVLYQDRPLTEVEFLFMENHFQVIEMAHLRWKRQHGNIRL